MLRFELLNETDFQLFIQASADRFIAYRAHPASSEWHQWQIRVSDGLRVMLPQGVETPGHWVFKAFNSVNDEVGVICFGLNDSYDATVAWGWDIYVYPSFQNGLLGYRILKGATELMREEGFSSLRFTVYKENKRALRLYRKLGYQVYDENEVQVEMGIALT